MFDMLQMLVVLHAEATLEEVDEIYEYDATSFVFYINIRVEHFR